MGNEADGTVTRAAGEGVYDLRFERRYGLPVETIWAALTEPARLADWLALAKVDLRLGGAIELDWPELGDRLEGVIIALEPMRLFAFTWSEPDGAPGSVVRWELTAEAGGCRLAMIHTLVRSGYLLDVGTGWHNILEDLPGAATRSEPRPWTRDRIRSARARQRTHIDRYRAHLPHEAAEVAWVEWRD